jgi:ankyrin repeat protein
MFRPAFDALPVEIILHVVDNLAPEDLPSLLHGMRWLPKLLTCRQMRIRGNNGNTLLHVLAENGEVDLINLLLSKDIDPNLKNRRGRTPLFCAVIQIPWA